MQLSAGLKLIKPAHRSPCRAAPCRAEPSRNLPSLALPDPAAPRLAASAPERAVGKAEALRTAVCSPCPSVPCHARPCLAAPWRTLARRARSGLTPCGCQCIYSSFTTALNRPCLGRQSPNPTSLPASLAISSISRRLSTSGSN